MKKRLVQIQRGDTRRVALVEEPRLRILRKFESMYTLAMEAIQQGGGVWELIDRHAGDEVLDYDEVYRGESEWRILVPVDHPAEPSRMLVSGTGLTHTGSARDRDAMHEQGEENLTDSMKMFRWGVEGGRPLPGNIGMAPEWFYKGTGSIVRAHGERLEVPPFAEDGGEEAEIAGVYIVGTDGSPWRIGMTAGNEFSDHLFEKKNYLNLAGSKLRTCSLGPELVVDADFDSIAGDVRIERRGETVWSKSIRTGEAEMCHSLRNIEHHHFKFDTHRRPGDVHVHFYGAHSLSFGDGIRLTNGDVMAIKFDGFGRALRNSVHVCDRSVMPVVAERLR